MKNFFRLHPDIVLTTIAVILLALLISFFIWTINDLVFEVGRAMLATPAQSVQQYDLKDAAKLNFRGLLSDTSTAIAPASSPTPASTTTTSTTITTTNNAIVTSTAPAWNAGAH